MEPDKEVAMIYRAFMRYSRMLQKCYGNLGAVPKAHTAAGMLPTEVPALHHENTLARLRHQRRGSRRLNWQL